jgi:hypothetical protein
MGAAWVAEADVPVPSGLVLPGRFLLPNPVISVRTYFIAGLKFKPLQDRGKSVGML